MTSPYQYTYHVQKEDIDDLKHVNNLKYLEWALKAAETHWNIISDESIREKFAWVVSRHEIDYLRPAFLGDEIQIRTWIESMQKASSIRIVEIYKKEKLIAKAKTTWVLIDAKTQKVCRIPSDFKEFL